MAYFWKEEEEEETKQTQDSQKMIHKLPGNLMQNCDCFIESQAKQRSKKIQFKSETHVYSSTVKEIMCIFKQKFRLRAD